MLRLPYSGDDFEDKYKSGESHNVYETTYAWNPTL